MNFLIASPRLVSTNKTPSFSICQDKHESLQAYLSHFCLISSEMFINLVRTKKDLSSSRVITSNILIIKFCRTQSTQSSQRTSTNTVSFQSSNWKTVVHRVKASVAQTSPVMAEVPSFRFSVPPKYCRFHGCSFFFLRNDNAGFDYQLRSVASFQQGMFCRLHTMCFFSIQSQFIYEHMKFLRDKGMMVIYAVVLSLVCCVVCVPPPLFFFFFFLTFKLSYGDVYNSFTSLVDLIFASLFWRILICFGVCYIKKRQI